VLSGYRPVTVLTRKACKKRSHRWSCSSDPDH
jgi:hypothetical protein